MRGWTSGVARPLQSCRSWLLAAIPGIGNLYALVDVLFIFREDRRCLHDLIDLRPWQPRSMHEWLT